MCAEVRFTKENLDTCLKRLAKEFRKMNGSGMEAEIILIGGAAVLAKYGFREVTYDVDALVRASSAIKDAINRVGDELNLPNGWLNSDFRHTKSYSPKLAEHSQYYRTFSNIVKIRIVTGPYLVAMKLMSGRRYKNDISDIVGILKEEKEKGTPITMEQIDKAVCDLYENWDQIPENSRAVLADIMESGDYDAAYKKYRLFEAETKSDLLEFEENYPDVLREDNVDDIIAAFRRKRNQT